MAKTVKIKFVKDHKMWKKGTVVDMVEDNVDAWLESGYAELLSKKKTSSRKAESKEKK
jgi:hypothetical protein